MKKKLIIFGIIIILIVAVAGFFVYQKYHTVSNKANNIINNVVADLTKHYTITEGDQNYISKFVEYQNKLEDAVKAYKNGGEKPNADFFIEKAKYAQYLGHSDYAKEILNDIFTYYDNSSVGWNNLAKLYEEDKNYVKANEYYQKMIDTFGEKDYWSFYYYICSNWMLAKDKTRTQECYNKYKSFGGSDAQIEEYLTK